MITLMKGYREDKLRQIVYPDFKQPFALVEASITLEFSQLFLELLIFHT